MKSDHTAHVAAIKASSAPKRTPPRMLTVVDKQRNGKGLIRITLSSRNLAGFPNNAYGAHIKLFFPQSGQAIPHLPSLTSAGVKWPPAHLKPITRTYSVRAYRENEQEIDVEFVDHGDRSPASGWARNAKIGDQIGLAGPGGPSPLLKPAQWSLLAGDLSAVPAIAAILEHLPRDAKAVVYIEVDDLNCAIPLQRPKNVSVHWLQRIAGEATLLNAIKQCAIPNNETLSAFIAGESSAVVSLRRYLVDHFGFTRNNLYSVPYWRRGQDEEAYHADRHKIMDEVY